MASMWTNKNLKSNFSIDNVRKIHNSVGIGFGTRVCSHTVGVKASFFHRRTYRPLSTPNFVIGNTKYHIDYCSQSYYCQEILEIKIPKIYLSRLEAFNAIKIEAQLYGTFTGKKHVIN